VERPREVRASHLARRAVVYARQSSAKQLNVNVGSTTYQLAQAEIARRWGWTDDKIDGVDDDLGLSGQSAGHRHGYQRLRGDVRAGAVGAVFVTDLSRLGRDVAELLGFLGDCKKFDVLVVVDGRVHDFDDHSQLFAQQVSSLVTEYENVRRREMMMRGRSAKAAAGRAVSAPPTGYVAGRNGTWAMDPDPAVREAIAAVFRAFLSKRSLKGTVNELNRLGVRIPARRGSVPRSQIPARCPARPSTGSGRALPLRQAPRERMQTRPDTFADDSSVLRFTEPASSSARPEPVEGRAPTLRQAPLTT